MGYLGVMWIFLVHLDILVYMDILGVHRYFGYTWADRCKQPVQVGQEQGNGASQEQSEIKRSIVSVGNLLTSVSTYFMHLNRDG